MNLITQVGSFQINQLTDLPVIGNHPFLPNELAVIAVLEDWYRNHSLTISTSGSTGLPTEICLPENLLRWSVEQTKTALSLNAEKVLLALSANKVGGAMMVIRSAIYGWDLMISEPVGNPMSQLNLNHDFTFTSLVPYQLTQIFDDPQSLEKLSRFNTVLIGGGSIPESLENKIRNLGTDFQTRFYHSYGMTETASHIAVRETAVNHNSTEFTAFKDVQLTGLENGNTEIQIPKLNFRIITNDQLEITGQKFKYLGRLDDVVNSGGVKIQLHEITQIVEREMAMLGLKNQFFFWKIPDEKWGEALVLVMGGSTISNDFLSLIKRSLSPVHQPKMTYTSNQFILTESGKIDRIATFQKSVEIGR